MQYLVTNRPDHFAANFGWKNFATVEESLKDLEGKKMLAVDTETTGLSFTTAELWCLQIGNGVNEYVIDLEESPFQLWEPIDILKYKDLLEASTCIGHNLLFDLVFLLSKGIRVLKVKDTFLAEYLLTAGLRRVKRNLFATQVRRLGASQLDKGQRELVITHGLNNFDNIVYSAEDVNVEMFNLVAEQSKLLDQMGMSRAWDLECSFSPVLAYMEYSGMYLNKKKWLKKVEAAEFQYYTQRKLLNDTLETAHPKEHATYFDINWGSPTQVCQLFKEIGVPVYSKKDEKDTVDAKHMRKFKNDFPIVKEYLTYKEFEKDISTYGRNWFDYTAKDHRIHTKTRQMVETGRIASGNVKSGPFPNMANVPSGETTRGCFEGQRSNVLIVADYSGQESMILADLSRAPKLLEFYLSGEGDLHSYAARTIWPDIIGENTPLAQVKSDFPELRQQAKAANFAIAYGGNGFTIANNLNIDPRKGDEIYEKYMAAFPGLSTYFEERKKMTHREGSILVSEKTGRRRFIEYFDEWKSAYQGFDWDEYRAEKKAKSDRYEDVLKPACQKVMRFKSGFERDSLNSPCQGIGSEMSKTAGILFYKWIIDNGYVDKVKIVNFVYDEWVAESTRKLSPKVAEALSESMETASSFYLDVLDKIPANPMVTKGWEH